jgi:hypothetical protein
MLCNKTKQVTVGIAMATASGIWCYCLTSDPITTLLGMCAFGFEGAFYAAIFWP